LYALSEKMVRRSFASKASRIERVKENLLIAFPEVDERELEKLVEGFFVHQASFITELILIKTGRFDFTNSVVNEKEFLARLDRLKRANEKGIVFLVAHFGNWEYMGHLFALNGIVTHVVAKEMKNSLIDEKIIVPFRTMHGNVSIERNGAVLAMSRVLRRKGAIGFLIDQMIPPPNGTLIEFFGKKAYASRSLAQLKLKFDPLVVPIFAVREGRGKFRVIIDDPIEYIASESDDKEERIRLMTQRYTDAVEKRIKEYPSQWQWSYRRWRIPRKNSGNRS